MATPTLISPSDFTNYMDDPFQIALIILLTLAIHSQEHILLLLIAALLGPNSRNPTPTFAFLVHA